MIPGNSAIIEVVNQKINISEKEEALLLSSFKSVSKNKNDYLVETGTKSQHLYFVLSGFVRIFHTDHNGNEITTDICSPFDFVTSFESFIKKEISKSSLQCLSNCSLLAISRKEYDELYRLVADWPVFCQGVYERHIMKMAKRLDALQNYSASERYNDLLKRQPAIALHTPVKHLASYLGIKPQSLSRIRKSH